MRGKGLSQSMECGDRIHNVILKDFLSAENYQILALAYEAWEQYIQNTISVEQKVFYTGSYYKNEDEMPIGGVGSRKFTQKNMMS